MNSLATGVPVDAETVGALIVTVSVCGTKVATSFTPYHQP